MVWAAEHRNLDAVQYLLSKGADPGIRDDVRVNSVSLVLFAGFLQFGENQRRSGKIREKAILPGKSGNNRELRIAG